VTVTEAAHLLGVSRRTIERRIADGTLIVTRDGHQRLVALPDDTVEVPHDATETTEARLSLALAQCAEIGRERDLLRQRVADLVSERDYLRSALAASLTTTQKLLPERSGQRPWWAFWRRDAASG